MASKFGNVAITRTRTNTSALSKVQCPQCNKWRMPWGKEDMGLCPECEEQQQVAQAGVEEYSDAHADVQSAIDILDSLRLSGKLSYDDFKNVQFFLHSAQENIETRLCH